MLSVVLLDISAASAWRACLASLPPELQATPKEIIVCTRRPGGPSPARQCPKARILALADETGPLEAAAQGIQAATGRFSLVLGTDVQISARAVSKLLAFMDANRQAALVGPRVDAAPTLFPENQPMHWLMSRCVLVRNAAWKQITPTGDGAIAMDTSHLDGPNTIGSNGWQAWFLPGIRLQPLPNGRQPLWHLTDRPDRKLAPMAPAGGLDRRVSSGLTTGADLLMFGAAASWLVPVFGPGPPAGTGMVEVGLLATYFTLLALLTGIGDRRSRPSHHTVMMQAQILLGGHLLGLIAMIPLYGMWGGMPLPALALLGALVLAGQTLLRMGGRLAAGRLRSRGIGLSPVRLMGPSRAASGLARAMRREPQWGYAPGWPAPAPLPETGDAQTVEDIDRFLTAAAGRNGQPTVMLCGLDAQWRRLLPAVMAYQMAGGHLVWLMDHPRGPFAHLSGRRMYGLTGFFFSPCAYYRFDRAVKRGMDICGAAAGLLLFFPLVAAVALKRLTGAHNRGGLLFHQVRVGRGGRPFTIHKLRTMVPRAAEQIRRLEPYVVSKYLLKMHNDPRVTKLGRWLRRTNFDEIPQFVNVLRGDMSLIGPRPSVPEEVRHYEDWHRVRLMVLPGMSGLWQCQRLRRWDFHEMLFQDIEYIVQWSPFLDMAIIYRTLSEMLRSLKRGTTTDSADPTAREGARPACGCIPAGKETSSS